MAKFPRVPITLNHGWYLHPQGCEGSEAFVYLPAYAAEVRDSYVQRGFMLLSVATGDMRGSGQNALRINPPSDDRINAAIAELQRRVSVERTRIEEAIAEAKESLEDSDLPSDERKLIRRRVRQLEAILKTLGQGIPTLGEARLFFMREYRDRVKMGLPSETRRLAEALAAGSTVDAMVAAAQLQAESDHARDLASARSSKGKAVVAEPDSA